MKKDPSKEWLKVNKICKEIKWMTYDPDYSDIDLKLALSVMEQLKQKLEKEISK